MMQKNPSLVYQKYQDTKVVSLEHQITSLYTELAVKDKHISTLSLRVKDLKTETSSLQNECILLQQSYTSLHSLSDLLEDLQSKYKTLSDQYNDQVKKTNDMTLKLKQECKMTTRVKEEYDNAKMKILEMVQKQEEDYLENGIREEYVRHLEMDLQMENLGIYMDDARALAVVRRRIFKQLKTCFIMSSMRWLL